VQFGVLKGSARSILVAERIALNFMQRMSGIASATSAMVAAAAGHPARILETRKTVPGLRVLDKWAVLIGGGSNHRIGAARARPQSVAAARRARPAAAAACWSSRGGRLLLRPARLALPQRAALRSAA
jgi:hypothetical protein